MIVSVAQDGLPEELQISISSVIFELRHKALMGVAVPLGTE